MEYDQHNNVSGAIALVTTAISSNTTTSGAIIDTLGFESIEFFILSGTLTDGSYSIVLQDGDDSGLSDAAAVSSDLVLGSLPSYTSANDNVIKRVGSVSKKRYQRLQIVSTGVTSGGTFTAIACKGNPLSAPVTNN